MGRKFGFSFSWRRALGLSAAKGKLSRLIGIPLTKSGRQRKAGRMLGDLVGTALFAGTEFAARSGSAPTGFPEDLQPTEVALDDDLRQWLQTHPADPTPPQDYWLVIRAIRLGDPLQDVSEMIPGLTSWAGEAVTGIEGLTDGRGLTVLAFGGRVFSIVVCFAWRMTLEQLAGKVAAHLSIPSDATWLDSESPDLGRFGYNGEFGGWVHGDELFIVSLTDGIASVEVATKSVMHKVVDLVGQALRCASTSGTADNSTAPFNQSPPPGATGPESTPKLCVIDPNQFIEYEHGGEVWVQYLPKKDETKIYHYIPSQHGQHTDPPFRPDLFIDGQRVEETHTFEILDQVSFSGHNPSTILSDGVLWITHKIASSEDWHFPPKTSVIINTDGKRFELTVYSHRELGKDEPSDAEFYEIALIAKPAYEMYMSIARATIVTVGIGTASFNLGPEIIASYRSFFGYLTPPR